MHQKLWSTGWDLNPWITALQAAAFATSPPVLDFPTLLPKKQRPISALLGRAVKLELRKLFRSNRKLARSPAASGDDNSNQRA
jgi:hypothetical protein